jgi:hypothetical protein
MTIFTYVVEEGKRWSRLVGLLGGKRTEHNIKNRYKAVVAKNRRRKVESDGKVAIRVLEQFRAEPQWHQGQEGDSRFKEEDVCHEVSIKEKKGKEKKKGRKKKERKEKKVEVEVGERVGVGVKREEAGM